MSLATYTSKTWTDYADSPCLEAVELNRIDSGIAAVTAELLALEAALPTTYQPISAELSALAALSSTGYAKRSGAAAWSVVSSIPQADVSGLTAALAGKEPTLGSPSTSGYLLSSTTAGVRSWVAPYTHPATHPQGVVESASGWITTALAGKQAGSSVLTSIAAQSSGTGLLRLAAGVASLDTTAYQPVSGMSSYLTTDAAVTTYLAIGANAVSASKLQTARTIAGASFDGSANISIPYANLTSIPSTFAPSAHTHAWSDIVSGKPTTLAGYGITDASLSTHNHDATYFKLAAGSVHGAGTFLATYPTLAVGDGQYGMSSLGGSLNLYSESGVVSIRSRSGSADAVYMGDIWHSGNFNPASKSDSGHTHTFASLTSKPTTVANLIDGAWAGASGYYGWAFTGASTRFGFSSTTGVVDVYADGNFYATDAGYLVWHAGNLVGTRNEHNHAGVYMPLSGGTMGGDINLGGYSIISGSTGLGNGMVSSIGGNFTNLQVLTLAAASGFSKINLSNNLIPSTDSGVNLGQIDKRLLASYSVYSYLSYLDASAEVAGPVMRWKNRIVIGNGGVLPIVGDGCAIIAVGQGTAGVTNKPTTNNYQAVDYRKSDGTLATAAAGGNVIDLDLYGRCAFVVGVSSSQAQLIL